MMASTSSGTLDASADIVRHRKYYADEIRCFVPSCKKYRRDNPNVTFFHIPTALKYIWCHAVGRNCPKKALYVCDEHINKEEDCIKSKSGRIRLKCTANLILTRTYNEDVPTEMENEDKVETMEIMPTIPTEFEKCDSASQCQVDKRHKAVITKPAVKSIGCQANIKAASVTGNTILSPPELMFSSTSGSSSHTLYEICSSSAYSTTSSNNDVISKDLSGRSHMLEILKENPKMYIGIPKEYYWLVEFLAKECALRELHILVTFFKIKNNDSIARMSDHFNFSEVTIIEIFKVCMPQLATFLQSYIYLPEAFIIKKTLPPVFKARYADVKCIIDCFEIQIEKPSDPLSQSVTWSQYKSCNTVKYLIACCPNGFICFISKGFGGRISDKAITEKSGLVDILPPGAVVLADRGFKGIETLLRERGMKLLRPPSVSAKETPTKKEVLQGKVIASLRIHVERLIRRLREFQFLKPHSVINHSHVRYIDESIIIASALVNLQDNLIKIL